MAGVLKKTTGLTGLAVSKTPHHTLAILYKKILAVLGKMPETAMYRKHTQNVVNERLSAVVSVTDVNKLEEKLQSGQVEELIYQAENELILARKMLVFKPWEPLIKQAPANQWKWPI